MENYIAEYIAYANGDYCFSAEEYEDFRYDQAIHEAEIAAENAWLHHAENANWEEYELERYMEDSRGVIQFEDAMAAAYGKA